MTNLAAPTELAWAAGFFDGEGNTYGRRRGTTNIVVSLSLAQIDRRPLERFQQAVGGLGRIYGPMRRRLSTTDTWVFRTSSQRDCFAILHHLWPYLGAPKREQAEPIRNMILDRWGERAMPARGNRETCQRGHPRKARSNGTWFCPECSRVSWRQSYRRKREHDEAQ